MDKKISLNPDESDVFWTVVWSAIIGSGIAAELVALRRRPNERSTLSAHMWWLTGQRFSPRWFLIVGGWSYLSWHFFNHVMDDIEKELS